MFWPDTGTGVDAQPERKAVQSAVRKFFTEGGVGVPPTVPGGDWFNQITNELLNVLAAAGLQPSKTDDSQLYQAISIISGFHGISCSTAASVQQAIDNSPSVCVDVYLNNVLLDEVVVIPAGKHVRFFGTATVSIDSPFFYEPATETGVDVIHPVEFVFGRIYNSISGYHSVHVKVAWQNAKSPLIVHDGFRFDCDNGSTAFRLQGGMFHVFFGNHRIDSSSYFVHVDCSLQDALGSSAPACPMNVEFSCSLTGGGNMFRYTKTEGSAWNAGEGFFLTNKFHSHGVKILAQQINAFIVNARMLESAETVFDSCFNSVFSPSYADRNSDGQWLLKIVTTKGYSFSIDISPKIMQGGTFTGDMIIFSDEDAASGSYLYGVSHGGGGVIQGGGNSIDTAGVCFDYAGFRNYSFDGSVFFSHMISPFRFSKPISRSTIKQFEARDVGSYALGLPSVFTGAWGTYYNRFDSLYAELPFNWLVPTFTGSSVQETIAEQLFGFSTIMQRAPIISSTATATEPVSNGPTLSIISYEHGAQVSLVKSASMTAASRTAWFGKLVLNATAYIAPR